MYEVSIDLKKWSPSEKKVLNLESFDYNSDFEFPKDLSIVQTTYKYNGNEPYWDQLGFEIFRNDELILTFFRNYHSTPEMAFVKQNGKEFIVTSADYQCITIINLTDKKIESFCYGNLGENSHDKGCSFCPTDFCVMDEGDGTINLKVTGCFWGWNFEYFYLENVDFEHFSLPDEIEMFDEDGEDECEEDECEEDEGDETINPKASGCFWGRNFEQLYLKNVDFEHFTLPDKVEMFDKYEEDDESGEES